MKKLSQLIREGIGNTLKNFGGYFGYNDERTVIVSTCAFGAAIIGCAKEMNGVEAELNVIESRYSTIGIVERYMELPIDSFHTLTVQELPEMCKKEHYYISSYPYKNNLYSVVTHLNDYHTDVSREYIADYLESEGY